jgi:hypothetical protein
MQDDVTVHLLKANQAVDFVVGGQTSQLVVAETAFGTGELPVRFALLRHGDPRKAA